LSKGQPSIKIDKLLVAGVLIAIVAITQFVVIVPRAMAAYPGGMISDRNSKGYSWSNNWLSDLGRTQALNGDVNAKSAQLFNTSIIALGLFLAVFFVASLRAFDELTWSGILMTAFGVSSGLGLIVIGLTPFDIYEHAHIIGLLLWIISMVIVVLLFAIQSVSTGGPLGWLIVASGICVIAGVFAYAISSSTSHVMFMQKIVVGIAMIWLAAVTLRVAMAAVYVIEQTKSRMRIANEQATQYLRQFERGKQKRYVRRVDNDTL
jgi:hypothetical membrane protein